MRYFRCKCGKTTASGSMEPPRCATCEDCGSDLASAPSLHRDPVPHDMRPDGFCRHCGEHAPAADERRAEAREERSGEEEPVGHCTDCGGPIYQRLTRDSVEYDHHCEERSGKDRRGTVTDMKSPAHPRLEPVCSEHTGKADEVYLCSEPGCGRNGIWYRDAAGPSVEERAGQPSEGSGTAHSGEGGRGLDDAALDYLWDAGQFLSRVPLMEGEASAVVAAYDALGGFTRPGHASMEEQDDDSIA